MRKSFCKKLTAVLLAGVMLFTVSGCGKDGKKENDDNLKNVKVPETKEMVYEGKAVALSGAKGIVDSLECKKDKLYFTTYLYKEEENKDKGENEGLGGTVTTGFYYANTDGTGVTEIKMIEWKENESLSSWTVTEDDNILYVETDNSEKKGNYRLCKMDSTGNEIFKEDITKQTELNPTDNKNISIAEEQQGNIVLASEKGAFIFDGNAKFVDNVEAQGEMNGSLVRTKDGQILLGGNENGTEFCVSLDTDKKKWGKKYEISLPSSKGLFVLLNGAEYDFYYGDEEGIYGYDRNSESAVKVVDFMASDMSGTDLNALCMLDEGKLAGFGGNGADGTITIYNKVNPENVVEKKTLVLGGIYITDTIRQKVKEFNKNNKAYRIEIKDYYNPDTDYVGKMTTDLITGNAPDILYLNDAPVDLYAAKGILEDLTPYYDSDKEISTDDIFPSVLEGMKSGDKICFVAPKFAIRTVVGRSKMVGKDMGWNFDDMQKALDEKGKGLKVFPDIDKMGILYSFESVYNDFINWETGECSFDSPEFKRILELSNENSEVLQSEEIPPYAEMLKDGSTLLNTDTITLDQIQVLQKLCGEDFTFVGYPVEDKSGFYYDYTEMLGMSSASEHKEGVWEFLRTYMLPDYSDGEVGLYDSTRIDVFDKMAENKMKPNYYAEECCDTGGYFGDFIMELEPVTKEQIDCYKELISHTTKRYERNDMLMTIIEEEAQAYFAGDKSVEDAAKIIQSRVTTYVNENK